MRGLRSHLTYANVMSTLAVILVIGGGAAYAANTVFSSDIVDGEVKTADLGANAVTEAKLAGGAVANGKLKNDAVTSGKVLNETLVGNDVAANSLKGTDIDESTLTNIGGGGPAGGDLTGTYPNPTIKANAVGSSKVANDSLTGADINESLLSGTSGRINMHPTVGNFTHQLPVPGLFLEADCESSFAQVVIAVDDPGTANAMIGGRGVDPDPTEADFFETRNDVHIDGLVLHQGAGDNADKYETVVAVENQSGSAQSESQIVVDAGGKTYSLALHMYTQDAGAYCEFLGTATVTE